MPGQALNSKKDLWAAAPAPILQSARRHLFLYLPHSSSTLPRSSSTLQQHPHQAPKRTQRLHRDPSPTSHKRHHHPVHTAAGGTLQHQHPSAHSSGTLQGRAIKKLRQHRPQITITKRLLWALPRHSLQRPPAAPPPKLQSADGHTSGSRTPQRHHRPSPSFAALHHKRTQQRHSSQAHTATL